MYKVYVFLALCSTFTLNAYVNRSLKVDDHKSLTAKVELIEENHLGVTRELIQKTVKLKLLSNGINPIGLPFRTLYVYVKVIDINRASGWAGISVAHIEVGLNKFIREGDMADKYGVQARVGLKTKYVTTNDKEDILRNLRGLLDDFLLDYLEANLENHQPSLSK